MPAWPIEHITGDVATFHALALPSGSRSATFFQARSTTLVLGSSQRDESVDTAAASRQGIDLVRRRSGGGGVLLWPGEYVWLDLVLPASDELWSDDIGRSMWWVGELWREALTPFEPRAAVHRGSLQRSRWSSDVCFAGVGPGEVLREGAKLVGISQRRTRHAARFQTMLHLRWRPDVVASLVAGSLGGSELTTSELAPLVATCSASAEAITLRLTAALQRL
jgi:lipoate---protein ligase